MDFKPLCVKCQKRMRVEKNGVVVGVMKRDKTFYYAVYADMHKCPTCGVEVVTRFADNPFTYDFNDYKFALKTVSKRHQIVLDKE